MNIHLPSLAQNCFACLLALVASVAISPLPADAQEKKYAHEFYHDFRGKPLPKELRIFGEPEEEFIKEEPAGFRIALPKTWIHPLGGVGFETSFGIKGDFEATGTFEILNAEEPPKGFGVGASLNAHLVGPTNERATLKRVLRGGGKHVVVWEHVPAKDAKYAGGASECPAMLLRLRLQRTGTTMHYQWAPGLAGDGFEEARVEPDFGGEVLVAIRMGVLTGRKPCDVDVRFLDLRIRSGGVSGDAKAAVVFALPKNPAKAPDEAPKNRTSLVMAILFGSALLVLLLSAIVIMLLRRRRPVVEPSGRGPLAENR